MGAPCAVHGKLSFQGNWGFNVCAIRIPSPIHIGLISDEPIRLAGLGSIFDQPAGEGHAQLVPIAGTLNELLSRSDIEYLVVDLSSSTSDMETLETIRHARPFVRLIVIGPQGHEDLIHDTIIAGARAYLDHTASPEVVRSAIEEVTRGSIWAPRRVLSKLIDRLLKVPDFSLTCSNPHLTDREREVLDLILMARSNREIARELGIEERTVKAHVGRLMRKTGSDNRIELTMRTLNGSKAGGGAAAERRQQERRTNERRKDPRFLGPLTNQ